MFKKLVLLTMVFFGHGNAMTGDDEIAKLVHDVAQMSIDGKSASTAKETKIARSKDSYVPKHTTWYEMIQRSHRVPENCLDFLLHILNEDFGITPENEHTKDQKELDAAAEAIAQKFKEKGIDVNRISDELTAYTFLHTAARGSRSKRRECNTAVLVLCYAGADVDAQILLKKSEDFKATALLLATGRGYLRTVRTLLRFNATLNICANWKRTALHLAAVAGDDLIVQVLCDEQRRRHPEQLHAFVNACDKVNDTPLHLACAHATLHANDEKVTQRFCRVITTLFEHEADGLARNKEYEIPENLLPVRKMDRNRAYFYPYTKFGMLLWNVFEREYEKQVHAAEAAAKLQQAAKST